MDLKNPNHPDPIEWVDVESQPFWRGEKCSTVRAADDTPPPRYPDRTPQISREDRISRLLAAFEAKLPDHNIEVESHVVRHWRVTAKCSRCGRTVHRDGHDYDESEGHLYFERVYAYDQLIAHKCWGGVESAPLEEDESYASMDSTEIASRSGE